MTSLAILPVTILTGFLGSGKTTLINQLLVAHPDEKIAIIENEFGAVGVDGQLLNQKANVDVIELSNGCVCCSVRGELTEALHSLLTKYDKGELSFQRIILETTGLADPAPVIQTFFVDDTLRERFMLDAVVTLVDSEHAQKQLDEHRVASSQIGFADRLILTKLDRIDDSAKQILIERLTNINPRAKICSAQFGQLAASEWLNIQAFNLDETSPVTHQAIKAIIRPAIITTNKAVHGKETTPIQSWHDAISSHVFTGRDMDLKRIGAFMEKIIADYGNDMLRYKGILAIHNESRRLIVQGIHKVVGFDYGSEWQPDEKRQTCLVIIGRDLPFAQFKDEFNTSQHLL